MTSNNIRLHLPGLPHTITNSKFSHCAFTGKVLRFSKMMMSRGFEVYFYGIESSESGADKQIDLMTVDQWNELRAVSLKQLKPELSFLEIIEWLSDDSKFIGTLANYDTILYAEFNKKFKDELQINYRDKTTDMVMLPFGLSHMSAIKDLDVVYVESGIGYDDSFADFRIFESYAVLHQSCAREKKGYQNYWFVCPNYYNIDEWTVNLFPDLRIGYFGRICDIKGCQIFSELAKLFPEVEFVMCGQGDDYEKYLTSPNISYTKPITGKERSYFLGSLTALVTPSLYCEPFIGVSVEAQLCGTPVIGSDFGALHENIEPYQTGLLCHTLADYATGIQMALDKKFDRGYISDRARDKWNMYEVAKKYEYALLNINSIFNGDKGWYSEKSYIDIL